MMRRRRHYFIKRDFQTSFFTRFILLTMIEALLIITFFFHIARGTMTTSYAAAGMRIEPTASFFLFPLFLCIIMIAIGISLAGMITFVLLSHRIVGPLYRFEHDLKEIREGNLTKRINLRKTDQLTPLKEEINGMVGLLDKKIGNIKTVLTGVGKLVDENNMDKNKEIISSQINSLTKEISAFNVTGTRKE